MALIAMAIWDTEENQRHEYTVATLASLWATVDFSKHRLALSDNGSEPRTRSLLYRFHQKVVDKYGVDRCWLIYNGENLGTAQAINKAWQHRHPGENAVKMDNDVVIFQSGWADELEEAIRRDPTIGICGLKRKDVWETPWNSSPLYRSELYMLPHQPGERWIIVEKVKHVIGTCQMYSSALLDKIGYLYQPRLYGFDDVLAALRCELAGFISVFLSHINIDHIDRGDNAYKTQKEEWAFQQLEEYRKVAADYRSGAQSIYYNPFEEKKAKILASA
jgi:GT2 family glycosyltransferase